MPAFCRWRTPPTRLSSQRARTHEDLMKAKAEFAEQQASIESFEKAMNVREEPAEGAGPGDAKPAKEKNDPPPTTGRSPNTGR